MKVKIELVIEISEEGQKEVRAEFRDRKLDEDPVIGMTEKVICEALEEFWDQDYDILSMRLSEV
jgi:hypothetical protein